MYNVFILVTVLTVYLCINNIVISLIFVYLLVAEVLAKQMVEDIFQAKDSKARNDCKFQNYFQVLLG